MKGIPERARAWATINLSALERNLRSVRQVLPEHLQFISVVKADAYGHGLAPVVTRLMRARADAFAVANLREAARIREVGDGWPILLLSVLLPAEYEEALRMGVIPVVSSVEEIRELGATAERIGITVGLHLKVDTGMGRLGIWYPQAPQALEEIFRHPALALRGICTHFSSADSDARFTGLQRDRFLETLHTLPHARREDLLIHADNSAGVESFPASGPFNAVRVGLIQFGIRPSPGTLLARARIEPVLSFHARIGLVKELPRGCPVSYGQTHRLRRDSTLAILTAGYADGLSTSYSNRGKVLIHGKRCPVVGRVTMDQTIVDVTGLDRRPHTGEVATFFGPTGDGGMGPSATEYAGWSNRIEWEALCSLTERTQRVYVADSAL